MNSVTAKKTRKPVTNNTKAKISKSVKNALNRNKAAAAVARMSLTNFRKMRKAAATPTPVAPNYNPFNYFNATPAPTVGPNPFNMFNAVPAANSKKNNSAKKAKMSAAMKASSAASNWMANVKKVQNTMKVPRQAAMVIAAEKRKEKAGAKKNNNVNLLNLKGLSLSNKKNNSKNDAKVNQNVFGLYGM